ncbi:MAG TPA: hypothetical protein VER96_21330 [Polyangiaceae bacterium]|nr:hypothetical protein [Polyangiaceae bacterium]
MKRSLVARITMAITGAVALSSAAFDFGLGSPVESVANAITEIDTQRATELLQHISIESASLTLERARLAVYLGECDRAEAILSNPMLNESREGASLAELAKSCARATAAGFVLEDKQRGVWLRLQDDSDRALAPFIFEVAAQARDTVSKEVGIDLPKPLRIDLVRDLFSLSAVSGLPLKAAETTGTLAVARWGRVIMLSPRAPVQGYPWQDTLAHEITHLLVTRATRDYAPLWMQEGLAKRFEVRWRAPRPFDKPDWADVAARNAALDGRSVGIDKLGPSIAMLPTPEAAGIAFAEVTSFMHFFIEQNGEAALRLLFADLRGNGPAGAEAALLSATGYGLSEWNARWQRFLRQPLKPSTDVPLHAAAPRAQGDAGRRVRLADLLAGRGYGRESAGEVEPLLSSLPRLPQIRARVASGWYAAGDDAAAERALGTVAEIDGLYGPWFALAGRGFKRRGELAEAEPAFTLGLSADPLSDEVACEGYAQHRNHGPSAGDTSGQTSVIAGGAKEEPPLPTREAWRELCKAARMVPRD